MLAKRKAFIVVMLGDRTGEGFDETSLPLLVDLMDSASPDYRQLLSRRGVAGYFVASSDAAERADRLVAAAEQLRQSATRFESLGIGISAGDMIADFTLFGRLRSAPLGTVANEASRLVASTPDAYLPSLTSIRDAYRPA
jgi:class 3 adenylate cyclase